jgi:hypothetical protein
MSLPRLFLLLSFLLVVILAIVLWQAGPERGAMPVTPAGDSRVSSIPFRSTQHTTPQDSTLEVTARFAGPVDLHSLTSDQMSAWLRRMGCESERGAIAVGFQNAATDTASLAIQSGSSVSHAVPAGTELIIDLFLPDAEAGEALVAYLVAEGGSDDRPAVQEEDSAVKTISGFGEGSVPGVQLDFPEGLAPGNHRLVVQRGPFRMELLLASEE